MTDELTGLPSLPAMPPEERERWRAHFENIEQLPVLSVEALRVLEQDRDGNALMEGRDALLEDWDFWSRYCESLSRGATRVAAARALGVPAGLVTSLFRELTLPIPEGAYNHIAAVQRRERIAEVYQRVMEAEGQLELRYTNILHEAAVTRGDTKVAQYLLERRFRQQWAPNKEVVHKGSAREQGGGTPGATIVQGDQVNIVNLPDDQLAAIDRGGKIQAPRKNAIPGKVIDVGDA